MTPPEDRRPGRPHTQHNQRPGEREGRPRRQPLFPLEDDDIAARGRRGPPAPLGDLLGDLDEEIPCKAAPPRPKSKAPDALAPDAGQRPRSDAGQARSPQPAARSGAVPTQAQTQAQRRAAAPGPERGPAPPLVTTRERPSPRRVVLHASAVDDLVEAQAAPLRAAHARMDETMADLSRLEHEAAARGQLGIGGFVPPGLPALSMSQWAWMGVIVLASLLVIGTLWGGDGPLSVSRWGGLLDRGDERRALFAGQARPAGDYSLRAPPSISAAQIDSILAAYGSPAAGTGEIWYNLGLQYGIDPAFAIAFFIHESAAGTAQAWAGLKSEGGTTHNVGNIICAGYATCYGRFRDYSSWEEGIDDWYRLIDVEYLQGRGLQTVADIIPIYAPSVENDVQGYINVVQAMVDEWRLQGAP